MESANKALKSKSTWKLYTDEASSFDGLGAGLMLVSFEGKEYVYALSGQPGQRSVRSKTDCDQSILRKDKGGP
ncbi:hypothetical protein Tco_0005598 [Tanacetum coccineum]